ncbi:hypothetical protein [Peribacillus sp. SCS-155]|uniref:hypothetical protein n=1 Tax=Peribacillus sedimenti TaxID=3115297 RepID=UPI003905E9C3
MRYSEKGHASITPVNQLMGVDFQNPIQREENDPSVELASEFGLNLREVNRLKKHLGRS